MLSHFLIANAGIYLTEATKNKDLQELLIEHAMQHAVVIHNTTPRSDDPQGRSPIEILHNRPNRSYLDLPVFGTDALVVLRKKTTDGRTENVTVPGIYVGTNTARDMDDEEHLVWTNFALPFETMNVVESKNVKFHGEFKNMRIAEAATKEPKGSGKPGASSERGNSDAIPNTIPLRGEEFAGLGKDIQSAFMANFGKLSLGASDSYDDTIRRAKRIANSLKFGSEPVEEKEQNEQIIEEAYLSLLEKLESSLMFKAFVAANQPDVFNKYFPNLSEYLNNFKDASQYIAMDLIAHYPFLIKQPRIASSFRKQLLLGEVLATFVEAAVDIKQSIHTYAYDEGLVIQTLIRHWKGTNPKAINGVINIAKSYSLRFKDYSGVNVMDQLVYITHDFISTGNKDICTWYNHKFIENKSTSISGLAVAEAFLSEVYPKMNPTNRKRMRAITSLLESQRIRYHALIKKMGCEESDFWSVQPENVVEIGSVNVTKAHSKDSVKKPATSETEKISPANKRTQNSETIIRLAMERLKQFPGTCTNCFQQHQLADCPHLEADSRNNLAAWIDRDYEKKTKQTRPKYQKQTAHSLQKGPAPAKRSSGKTKKAILNDNSH